jgi:hypothetical protein
VVQLKVAKHAPRNCQLGVGSMGLALFDGLRPTANSGIGRIVASHCRSSTSHQTS